MCEITYTSLNEALIAGVSVTHVGNNGEYVEYITFLITLLFCLEYGHNYRILCHFHIFSRYGDNIYSYIPDFYSLTF